MPKSADNEALWYAVTYPYMDHPTLAWLSLIVFGFVFGLASGPMTLLRIGIGLTLLAGLGVLLADISGHDRIAHWFVIGMVSVLVAFLVAMVGAVVGAAVRQVFRPRPLSPRIDRPVPAPP